MAASPPCLGGCPLPPGCGQGACTRPALPPLPAASAPGLFPCLVLPSPGAGLAGRGAASPPPPARRAPSAHAASGHGPLGAKKSLRLLGGRRGPSWCRAPLPQGTGGTCVRPWCEPAGDCPLSPPQTVLPRGAAVPRCSAIPGVPQRTRGAGGGCSPRPPRRRGESPVPAAFWGPGGVRDPAAGTEALPCPRTLPLLRAGAVRLRGRGLGRVGAAAAASRGPGSGCLGRPGARRAAGLENGVSGAAAPASSLSTRRFHP